MHRISQLLRVSIFIAVLLVVSCGDTHKGKANSNTIDLIPSELPEEVSKALDSICLDDKFDKAKIADTPGLCQGSRLAEFRNVLL